ncbi:hypothetical protein B296_00035632 [Ensete ventricosum]|uniref:Uncharacterized protein n=1 Tax=Ensete ventricosum TaxID=4639 RepID=A0A426XJW0_ENSVE|nr:hypothetical protein B296_00035632 [Ensete ventricosum]
MAREERIEEEGLAAKAADLAAEGTMVLVVHCRGGGRRGLRLWLVVSRAKQETEMGFVSKRSDICFSLHRVTRST